MEKQDRLLAIGNRIKERRIALGISQEALAFEVGYKSRTSINKIELGKTDIVQSMIVKIANALQTTPAFLMGWTDEFESEYNPAKPSGNVFAFEIKGHSMEPRMFDGDTVIVKKQDDVESGEIAIVEIEGKVVARKVIKQDSGIMIVGLNAAAFSPKFYPYDQVRIIGKVVEVRGNVDGWNN
ncbi:LexA family protein [Bacilliculturomica massiliensis]|uniref:LexA family protein n=1 Tax=Bacilliculturomica massiliensis TaxID=1917867 RepID=UPI0010319121|nr:XRE family transcriptional regulator [Bacilliculturomica massiliensis]